MKTILLAVVVGGVSGWPCGAYGLSEAPRACFRSVADAAAQTHAGEAEAGRGFRLEDVRRDPLTNKVWAMVRSCEHPEQPPITVAAQMGRMEVAGAQRATEGFTAPMVRAGATVRLVQLQANVRLEMPAVAQSNGMLGDRIRVRVVRSTGGVGANEQVLLGIVRGPEVLELEQE